MEIQNGWFDLAHKNKLFLKLQNLSSVSLSPTPETPEWEISSQNKILEILWCFIIRHVGYAILSFQKLQNLRFDSRPATLKTPEWEISSQNDTLKIFFVFLTSAILNSPSWIFRIFKIMLPLWYLKVMIISRELENLH